VRLITVTALALVGLAVTSLPRATDAVLSLTNAIKTAAVTEASVIGRGSVIDGDTIEIGGERVRFHGIDAPESDQLCEDRKGQDYRCGAVSANALDKFLAKSRPARCDFVDRDQYGRFVGNCYRADGVNIAASLVRSGLALDWPRYSNGLYADEQRAAKAERIGLWQGKFTQPWEWRAQQREPVVQEQPAPVSSLFNAPAASACDIKGNISKTGERIYHVPGQKFYEKTKISEGKGERWFCSEADAIVAGWRAAKR
jgi:endonuclease YncB( thermonuclease family)